jgi:membrane protease YdiL (CAAX protease family)
MCDPRAGGAATADERLRVTPLRRAWLTLELLAIYIAAPVAVYTLLHRYHIPLFKLLVPFSALFVVILAIERSFSWRETLAQRIRGRDLAGIVAVFAAVAPLLAFYAWQSAPDRFLTLPRAVPQIWLVVMVLYPLISVTAQEVMYRVYFFHRYGPLFNGDHQAAIALNAVLFAFGHVLFNSVPSLVISFFGGLLFAWRYDRTRSYWAVVLEHALYGDLIFTLGLGRHFYTGVANF